MKRLSVFGIIILNMKLYIGLFIINYDLLCSVFVRERERIRVGHLFLLPSNVQVRQEAIGRLRGRNVH